MKQTESVTTPPSSQEIEVVVKSAYAIKAESRKGLGAADGSRPGSVYGGGSRMRSSTDSMHRSESGYASDTLRGSRRSRRKSMTRNESRRGGARGNAKEQQTREAEDFLHYIPLIDTNCLRLLKRSPVKQDPGLISFEMHTFSIGNTPDYRCLSYTWSDPDRELDDKSGRQMKACMVNGKRFNIHANLGDALFYLATALGSGWIWIDAICINQASDIERAEQVNKMCLIFQMAEEVVVWLGKDHGSARNQLSDANLLASAATFQELIVKFKSNTEGGLDGLDEKSYLKGFGLEGWKKNNWAEISCLCEKKWFWRIWVVQEVAVARQLSMFYGGHEVDLEMLLDMSRFLTRTGLSSSLASRFGKRKRPSDFGETLLSIDYARQILPHEVSSVSTDPTHISARGLCGGDKDHWDAASMLLMLIYKTRNFEAKEPADMIFALLGIVRIAAEQFLIEPCPLMANYIQSACLTFTEVAEYLILQTPVLGLLSLVQDRALRKTLDLPSWVPDFAIGVSPSIISQNEYNCFNASRKRFHKAEVMYCTINGRRKSGSMLKLEGALVGEITRTAASGNEFMEGENFKSCLEIISYLKKNEPDQYGDDLLEAWWRTLLLGYPIQSPNLSQRFEKHQYKQMVLSFESFLKLSALKSILVMVEEGEAESVLEAHAEWICTTHAIFDEFFGDDHIQTELNSLIELVKRIMDNDDDDDDDKIDFAEIPLLKKEVEHSHPFTTALRDTFTDRRLFCTESGHLGLGMPSGQPGDLVFVIAGAQVPFVFRKTPSPEKSLQQDCYQLVGEAYVHGIMYGELLDSEDWQWQDLLVV